MLRVQTKPPVPAAEPDPAQIDQMPEATDVQPADPQTEPKRFSADKLDPDVVRYMTSDLGPFICANCEHYGSAGDCNVVSGPIDPEGTCAVFTPMGDSGETEPDQAPDDAAQQDQAEPEPTGEPDPTQGL